MPLNFETQKTHYQFDGWRMLVIKDDPASIDNALGGNVMCWIPLKDQTDSEDRMLLEGAIEQCIDTKGPGGRKWKLIRHPDKPVPTSRDHWSYLIIFYKMMFSNNPVGDHAFKGIAKNVPWMRGMNLWRRALAGRKLSEWLYYTLYTPLAWIRTGWLWFCRWAGCMGEERSILWWVSTYSSDTHVDSNNRGWELQHNRTPWQLAWRKIILATVPAFALQIRGWQLWVMPSSPRKERLKRILLRRVRYGNPMMRLLFGDQTVTIRDVTDFPDVTGFPSGVYMDPSCSRDIRLMTPDERAHNTYEKDLLLWLATVSALKATGESFDKLRDAILELGAETRKSVPTVKEMSDSIRKLLDTGKRLKK